MTISEELVVYVGVSNQLDIQYLKYQLGRRRRKGALLATTTARRLETQL